MCVCVCVCVCVYVCMYVCMCKGLLSHLPPNTPRFSCSCFHLPCSGDGNTRALASVCSYAPITCVDARLNTPASRDVRASPYLVTCGRRREREREGEGERAEMQARSMPIQILSGWKIHVYPHERVFSACARVHRRWCKCIASAWTSQRVPFQLLLLSLSHSLFS